MIFCFDVDGTLCRTVGMDYSSSEPIPERIERVKQLMAQGHEVVFYTARGQGIGNVGEWLQFTAEQLRSWGLAPKGLIDVSEKPAANVYVDDLATNAEEFFE